MGAISRRRALGALGTAGLGVVAAACSSGSDDAASTTSTAVDGSPGSTTSTASGSGGGTSTTVAAGAGSTVTPAVAALFDEAGTCTITPEETEGPYWFDVDSVRRDIREDREGTPLRVGLRVQDAACEPIADAVVEVWHCDALGSYSGFESASSAANGPRNIRSQQGPGGGGADRTDEETYLRGAQVTDANGIAEFLTVYPGWYTGRAIHIHFKVHLGNKAALTSQLYFPDDTSDVALEAEPYAQHTGDRTTNDQDMIFDEENVVAIEQTDGGWAAALNVGLPA